ncbi:uncharacterized protein LOC144931730 isoform X2 [Lampetra fluviatilis]
MARLNRPAAVEVTYKNMRFLITHNPTNVTLDKFIEELKKCGVTTVVRVCEATYDKVPVENEGIAVLVSKIGPLTMEHLLPAKWSMIGLTFSRSSSERSRGVASLCTVSLDLAGSVEEPSTASSFCTWRSIILRCVFDLRIQMDKRVTAAFNRFT